MTRIVKLSVLVAVLWATGLAQAQLAVLSLTVSSQDGADVVRIQTSEPLTQLPPGFALQEPARIAFDIAGATNATGQNLFALNLGNLRSAPFMP